MSASSLGDKYQITLQKPAAKISNFIPEEIKLIQQQLNNRNNRNAMMEMYQMRNASSSTLPINSQISNQLQNLSTSNPISSASTIIQHIAQIRQQPFTGTISLHNNQFKNTLTDVSNQGNGNHLNRLPFSHLLPQQQQNPSTISLTNDNQINANTNNPSAHISTMNLPYTTAGLNPPASSQPKIVHVHHHETSDSNKLLNSNAFDEPSYQNINAFESSIRPGSLIAFQSVLSKRQGLNNQNEPVIKELPLNKITRFLEKKKKKGKLYKNEDDHDLR